MNKEQEAALQVLHEIGEVFNKVMKDIEDEQESYWNSLSKDDQLKCFCSVVRRIVQGDVRDRGTYRYVLYDVFGFGPESYVQAQDAGYMTIHNLLFEAIEKEEESPA